MFTKKNNSIVPEIRVIQFLHFIIGYYYEISSLKLLSALHRLYCILVTTGITVWVSCLVFEQEDYTYDNFGIFLLAVFLVENIVCSLTALLTNQAYVSTYCTTLRLYDAIIGYKSYFFASKPLIVWILFFMIVKTMHCVFMFKHILLSFFNVSLYVITLGVNLNFFKIVLVLGLFQTRLSFLRETLEGVKMPVNIIGQDEVRQKFRIVRKCVLYYGNLLDLFDDIDAYLEVSVSLYIVLSVD